MFEEMDTAGLAAILLKENDREVTLKNAVRLGLKTCFGLAKQYVEDVEDLVRNSQEVGNNAAYDDDGQI